jgi:hypothetical protein
LWGNWSIKAEYLFVDFGAVSTVGFITPVEFDSQNFLCCARAASPAKNENATKPLASNSVLKEMLMDYVQL